MRRFFILTENNDDQEVKTHIILLEFPNFPFLGQIHWNSLLRILRPFAHEFGYELVYLPIVFRTGYHTGLKAVIQPISGMYLRAEARL